MTQPKKNSRRLPVRQLTSCLLALTLSAWLSACATSYKMKVDALTSPKSDQAVSYKIENPNPGVETDSLRYKEVEKAVKAALSAKGMYEAPNAASADVNINLEYGINPPVLKPETYSKSVYETVRGQTHTEVVPSGTDAQGNTTYTTITTRDPDTKEYVGEQEYVIFVVDYEKYLRLSARENKPVEEGRQPKEVWAVDVTSDGTSNNLRKYIPILAAATIGYIGKETSEEKSIRLKDNKDGDIAFIKKGLPTDAAGANKTAGKTPTLPQGPDKPGRIPALPFAASSKS